MHTHTIPRAQYDRAHKGYPQLEVVKVGAKRVKVRTEEAAQRRMKHTVKPMRKGAS